MNDLPDRDFSVFTAALQLPAAERAAYLARACGDDHALRQKVEALLKGHDQVGDFLENSHQTSALHARAGVSAGEKPGDGRRSDSEGGKPGRRKWRSDRTKLPTEARGCVVLKLERARAEQSEQHGRRGAWRRGAERVLVPANYRSVVAGSSCGCPSNERVARGPVSDPKFSPSHSPDPKIAQGTPVYRLHWSDPDTVASDLAQCE